MAYYTEDQDPVISSTNACLAGFDHLKSFEKDNFIVFIVMNASSIATAGHGRIPLIKFLGNRIASARHPEVRVADRGNRAPLTMNQPFAQLPNRFRRMPLGETEIEIIRVSHWK
jgi:hypothetical protein